MADKNESKSERVNRQAHEIEANQKALLESIAHSKRLVEESEEILRRHRRERGDEEANDGAAEAPLIRASPVAPHQL